MPEKSVRKSVLATRGPVWIFCAHRPWNIAQFRNRISKFPGRWHLITSPEEMADQHLDRLAPRKMFFADWSWRVPASIVNKFECVGFHPTDLPLGRGGSPYQNLIWSGAVVTKMTAFRLADEMDAGPVYFKRDLDLSGSATQVFRRASGLIAEMIDIIIRNDIVPVPQQGATTHFKRRRPEQSRLQAQIENPGKLYDFIRMLDAETYPRAFVDIGNLRIEFRRATLRKGRVEAVASFEIVRENE